MVNLAVIVQMLLVELKDGHNKFMVEIGVQQLEVALMVSGLQILDRIVHSKIEQQQVVIKIPQVLEILNIQFLMVLWHYVVIICQDWIMKEIQLH